jgi:hypothetical protein
VSNELVSRAVADLPTQVARLIDERLPEVVVRTWLGNVSKDAPVEVIAGAAALAKYHGLDLLSGHLAIFQPRESEPWRWFVTVEGRIALAARHPDFEGVTFSDPEDLDGEVWVRCFVHRKSWSRPLGPVIGRCQREGQRKGGGGTYPLPWAPEIARTRALRAALRIGFGFAVPDPDAGAEAAVRPTPMRDDQRRSLFAYAAELGWSDEVRRERAGVASFTELDEERAAALVAEWERLVDAQRTDREEQSQW